MGVVVIWNQYLVEIQISFDSTYREMSLLFPNNILARALKVFAGYL